MNTHPTNPLPHDSGDRSDPRHARLDDLLIERTLAGLSPADTQELELLAASLGRDASAESFDTAAAAFDLAFSAERPQAPMPAELHERVLLAGQGWARAQRGAGHGGASESFDRAIPGVLRLVEAKPGDGREFARVRVVSRVWRSAPVWGGWLAAAACLLLAVNLYSERSAPSAAFMARRDLGGGEASISNLVRRSPVALLDEFLSSAGDRVSVRLASMKSDRAPDARAEVVWSPGQRTGFLKVSGLPANDTAQSRYQIWVVDATRREPYPVDAGLFDIPLSGGQYVVPINARLPVGQPRAFAVSIEAPEGTVVSGPERLILAGEMEMGPALAPEAR